MSKIFGLFIAKSACGGELELKNGGVYVGFLKIKKVSLGTFLHFCVAIL